MRTAYNRLDHDHRTFDDIDSDRKDGNSCLDKTHCLAYDSEVQSPRKSGKSTADQRGQRDRCCRPRNFQSYHDRFLTCKIYLIRCHNDFRMGCSLRDWAAGRRLRSSTAAEVPNALGVVDRFSDCYSYRYNSHRCLKECYCSLNIMDC